MEKNVSIRRQQRDKKITTAKITKNCPKTRDTKRHNLTKNPENSQMPKTPKVRRIPRSQEMTRSKSFQRHPEKIKREKTKSKNLRKC